MRHKNSAFTIIEIIVVITIIAILSSLAVITFNSVRKDSRDAARQSNATIISEALEKYYEKHGEYPSVAGIANSQPGNTGDAVATKLAIPVDSLRMPNMPSSTTNGIAPGSEPIDNYLVYEASSASNNADCQANASAGCDRFTLRYIEEGSEEVRTIESRRSFRASTIAPELSVTATSTTSIDATWSEMPGATSYTLQRSLSSDMSSPTTTAHTTTTATASSLATNTEYFFRVNATLPSGTSGWSSVESAVTSNTGVPVGVIDINAEMSGSNAVGTASGGACSPGTIERQVRYRINIDTWQPWEAINPKSVAATQGYTYYFQAQARCTVGMVSGPWVQSGVKSVTRPVNTPTGTLTINAYMEGNNARGQGSGGSCAAGTTIERQIRWHERSSEAGPDNWQSYSSQNPRNLAAKQGWKYTFEQRARCKGMNADSGWANSGQDTTVRPITAKQSSATVSVTTVGVNTTFTMSANTACPTGTTATYAWRYITAPGYYNYPTSWAIGHPDYDSNPRHNWGPIHPPNYGGTGPGEIYYVPGTTSTRSFTRNTAATNTTYYVDFQSWCKTVYTEGPWMDTLDDNPLNDIVGSYYRS